MHCVRLGLAQSGGGSANGDSSTPLQARADFRREPSSRNNVHPAWGLTRHIGSVAVLTGVKTAGLRCQNASISGTKGCGEEEQVPGIQVYVRVVSLHKRGSGNMYMDHESRGGSGPGCG
jgi:hypothetical protein